jgi:hypothetical protein
MIADEILQTLADLYASEINVKISTFWDAGYDWALGDELNGFWATGNARTFSGAVEHLADAAMTHYPESACAKARIGFGIR